MTEPAYDLMIRGGRVATATDGFEADVAVSGEAIAAIGHGLGTAKREIDARGKLVLPGGVDAHAHIEQLSAAGIMNADTFESASVSAAFGGTTTVIPFAAQHVGMNLRQVVEDYHALAKKGSVIDYAFHMIIADPTRETLEEHVPALVKQGHASIKIFMTYDRLKIDDEPLLDILAAARESGALLCAHAENHGIIAWMVKRLLARGYTMPKYHAISHARISEAEAFNRLIGMAALIDQPIMIFHVSTAEGAKVIRDARGQGLKVFAETCPQYLFLTAEDLDKPGADGAKWMCSPPPRRVSDQDALWQALALGDLQTVSSDHAPYRFDETGKLRAGPNPNFKQVANGLPGLQVRLPLLFDAMVSKGRLGLEKFVELTATAPAKIYNLHPRKGSIAVGADADIAIWDPAREVTLQDEMMHDLAGYTPFAGRKLRGWPVTVLSRGRVIVADGKRSVEAGSGRFLPRSGGEAAKPTGRIVADMDPALNFGAKLL
ncbi:dihydropyrimidinase [Bradyrhizobium sp. LMTR 3]|uniref:dihydropyrimidinase n=1 Tax=Bradyrhizobium sp. LMTR 3 TaxID=189873 RepID=UPI0008106055|nr:dihydropyrimidinase [Bradyrhizobium sp. LMTR 3]OCK53563.1 dihydropyrimidinase [Bradyrhizobium sp. LMTR 3]